MLPMAWKRVHVGLAACCSTLVEQRSLSIVHGHDGRSAGMC